MTAMTLEFADVAATLNDDLHWDCDDADLRDSLEKRTEILLLRRSAADGDPQRYIFNQIVDWLKPDKVQMPDPPADSGEVF